MAQTNRLGWGMDERIHLARWWGLRNGLKGRAGGWIYRDNGNGRRVCQGWIKIYRRHYREIWDALERGRK